MAENEEVKSKRQLLTERMQSRYPDMDFSDDEALFGRISDDFNENDERLAGFEEREGKLAEMFAADPRSARLMTEWRNGDDPAVALVRLFGEDIAEARNDPERQEAMKEANREYMERVAKEKEYQEQYETNLEETLKIIEEKKAADGLSDEQIDQAMGWLMAVVKDAVLGKFSAETIDMAIKAQNYELEVENARQEGEVLGRNAKIEEQLRKPKKGDGTAQLDGKNGGTPRPAARPDFGAIDRFSSSSDIWSRGGEKRRRN